MTARIEDFAARKRIKEECQVPPDGYYVCGCGCSLWILVKNGDCVCSSCMCAQARITVKELAPVETR